MINSFIMYSVHMKYKLYQTDIQLFFLVFNLENTFSERTFFWKGGNLFTTFFITKTYSSNPFGMMIHVIKYILDCFNGLKIRHVLNSTKELTQSSNFVVSLIPYSGCHITTGLSNMTKQSQTILCPDLWLHKKELSTLIS